MKSETRLERAARRDRDRKKVLELWTADGKTWQLRYFAGCGGSVAGLSEEEVLSGVESEIRTVEEEGLEPD